MCIQRPKLKELAKSMGLSVSIYPLEEDVRIGVGCDIYQDGELIHHLSTLDFDKTTTLEDAATFMSLLVARASIIINDHDRLKS